MDSSNETGFHHSNLTAHYMSRPRLDKLFDQATRCKLIYVIAGAGYGKTQTVHRYVEQQQNAIIRWVSLTESDNITSRYWENLTYVISLDHPELGAKLRKFGFPESLVRFEQFVEMLESMEHRSRKIFLVQDDFHLIHSKEVLTFVERCAHMQFSGVCVILLSRKEPELNILSLLSKGKVSMITEDELRFTNAETEKFFREQAVPFSARDVSQLVDATNGWVLAINMFSLILKRMPNHFKHAFDAMMKNMFKFMESEAWDGLPENVQKMMLKVSLLPDLPIASLRGFFDDTELSQKISSFVSFIRFDSFTNDFKIHPLYLEFLQSKHNMLSPEEKREAYWWAAQWCSEHDFHVGAMHYYAKARQFECMVKAFFSYPLRLPADTSKYFLNILEGLGAEEESDPNVLFLKNYFTPLLLASLGRYEEAKARALTVIQAWEHVDTPLATIFLHTAYSNLTYIDMYLCTSTHRYESPAYLKKAVEYLGRDSIPAAKVTKAFVNADIRSFACLVGEGADLAKFDAFLEAARQTALYIAETPYNIYAGYEELVACEICFFKNQPNLARKHAHQAILKAREKEQYSIVAMAEQYLLRIAMQEGNVSLTNELFKQLHLHLENLEFWNRQLYHDLTIGGFYIQTGLLERVPQWLVMNEKELLLDIRIPLRELIVNVWYCIASQKHHQALTVLGNSYPREPQERFLFGELRLSLFSAIARIQVGDTAGALAEFERAYQLSFQGVFEMFFIEFGKLLHPLVAAALKQADTTLPKEWLKTIDRKASIYAKKVAVISNAFRGEASIKESVSLSEREREVLLDLYHGLSREEIATNRYLSINTVKKTLQSIYIKLDAGNSVDAIRIALEKKLIE